MLLPLPKVKGRSCEGEVTNEEEEEMLKGRMPPELGDEVDAVGLLGERFE